MNVAINGPWEGFVADAVRDGRFDSASDMVSAGLRLRQAEEEKLQALRETLAASIARGGSYTDKEVRLWVAARHERRLAEQAAE